MSRDWNDHQPIYRQLRDRIVGLILDGIVDEGSALPSVRALAAEYRVNPVTVLKGYRSLVDEDVIEMRRGLGMFVNEGARERLLRMERNRFISEQWPAVEETIARLGLDADALLGGPRRSRKTPKER